MRFLIVHHHTLHAKATVPLALLLLTEGHEVVFASHRDRWRGFSARYVRSRPTSVTLIDTAALRFVARIVGLERAWAATAGDFVFERAPHPARFDAVIGTTKELESLGRIRDTHGVPAIALGYQHLPVAVLPGGTDGDAGGGGFFLEENPFTLEHGFPEILRGRPAFPTGFTYLDTVIAGTPPTKPPERTALVFLPGGWRGVDSDPGDGRKTSYAKQAGLIGRACLPLLENGIRPVLKVHPLRARHHDIDDVERLVRALEVREGLTSGAVGVLGPEDWPWNVARTSDLVVGYGSSSIYELWAVGIERAVVCDFEGSARSSRFRLFPGAFVATYDQYRTLARDPGSLPERSDAFTREVAHAYHVLQDGASTRRVADLVLTAAARRGRRPQIASVGYGS